MVQWYPGHMAKAIKEMQEKVKLVDLILILLDARIPSSSLNPVLMEMFANKKIVYVFTKCDKADERLTKKWANYYTSNDSIVVMVDGRNSKSINIITNAVEKQMVEKREKDARRGLKPRPIKTMIVGIPNVGKSTLINTLVKKKVAVTADRPGVTKNQQWVRVGTSFELLDTPGVLWPKFDNPEVGYKLSISGAVKDDVVEQSQVAEFFIKFLMKHYPDALINRYHIELDDNAEEVLNRIAVSLNFYRGDKIPDIDKAALYLLQEYRNGYFGNLTLDWIE